MAIIDELERVLGKEAVEKIKADAALNTRVVKGDELYGYYAGDEEVTTTTTTVTPPPTTTTTAPPTGAPGNAFSLQDIERVFDRRIASIGETVKTTVQTELKTILPSEGQKLRNSILADTHALTKLERRHVELTGKPLDEAEFNTFLAKDENKNRFRTIAEAGDAFLAPQAEEQRINARVEEKLKSQSGQHVPGTTPGPAVAHTGNVLKIMQRGKPGEGGGSSAVERASARLQKIEAARGEAAS